MLSQTKVLSFIKQQMGFPFHQIELTDEQITEYLEDFTLPEFSHYVPHTKAVGLYLGSTSLKVPNKQNEYYLNDDDGLEILNVKDIFFKDSNFYIHGHPPLGVFSMGELKQFALDVHNSMMVKKWSNWDYTYEFKHPNIIRISPYPNSEDYCAVEYETVQPKDFSGIPNDLQRLCLEFCSADIGIIIGRIRRKYADGNLRTPFGEIPLMGEIYQESVDKKRELIERMQTLSLPNVVLDFA